MFGAIFRWRLRLRSAAADRAARRRERSAGAEAQYFPARETRGAVKGVARRVVIVSDPDPTFFEEAIFVVREDFARGGGVGESELLCEARKAAGDYIETALGRPPRRTPACLRPAAWAAAGAASAALLWLAFRFFGVI